MNRADALVLEALGGPPDLKREYTLVAVDGRSRHELADDGWLADGDAQGMLVMSRVRIEPEPKVEPEPVAAKVKPAAPPKPSSAKPTTSASASARGSLDPRPASNKPTREPAGRKPRGRFFNSDPKETR